MKPIIFCFLLSATFASCQQNPNNVLQIATSANAQFAIKEIGSIFTQETGIEVNIIQGSSGKLLAQITEGAPYDIFISADLKYPQELYRAGLATQEPSVYAYGKLVLWTSKKMEVSLDILNQDNVFHIALANPKTAPYGLAAKQFLQHHKLFNALKEKLVFGESISQTTQFINSGAAEIGFTALSVVMSPPLKNVGHWIELDTTAYSPIAQSAVIIKTGNKSMEQAEKFYQFLFTHKAKIILKKYGYLMN